jgi:predicted nucleic acid-binding Zn finger protein
MPSEQQVSLINLLCINNVENFPIEEDAVLKRFGFVLYDNIKLLESSLDILDGDKDSIVRYKNEISGRVVWKVRGSQGKEYTCMNNFCSCPSFLNQVRHDPLSSSTICKHILGIKLGTALNRVNERSVNNDKFIELLCDGTNSGSGATTLSHYNSSSFKNQR